MSNKFVIPLLASLCIQIFAAPSLPYEHAIRSSLAKDHSLHKGIDEFDVSSKKGLTENEAQSGYAQDGGNKQVQSQNSGHYDHQNGGKKAHENTGSFIDEDFHNVNSGTTANVGKKVAHKKGHHKTGFHNTYHKDESGGNSSFYDDAHDEGDEAFYDSNQRSFGDLGGKKQRGYETDHSLVASDQARRGDYNQGGRYGNEHGNNRKFERQRYYDDHDLRGASKFGDQFGERGLVDEHNYNSQRLPYYHHRDVYPLEKPVHYDPTPKITIYEDPRYYESNYQERNYQRRFEPEVNYRPSTDTYYKRPVYDYYGY